MKHLVLFVMGVINHLILRATLTLRSETGDFGGGKKKAEEGVAKAGSELYERGKATPEETEQYTGSFDIGKLLEEISKYQMGLGAAPGGYLSPEAQYQQGGQLAQGLYGQTLTDLQDPYASFESTLQPQLQAAEDYINRGFQQRGLLRSGLPIEAMGRAGVELAIQEANARMNWRQQGLQNASSLTQNAQASGQERFANLGNLYGQQQTYGQNALNRQANVAQAAAQYQSYPYQARLGDIYGRYAALYALPGQMIEAGGKAAAAAALAGCWVAKEIFGSWEHPKTIKARFYIQNIAPDWFREFYLKHGEKVAEYIHNKPILKIILRPLFEYFALQGEVSYGLI